MKVGIFTDSHYCSREGNCDSLQKIKAAVSYFEKENCSIIVFLGDLIDKEDNHKKEIENLKQISDIFNKCSIKIYVIIGNHDTFSFTKNEFYTILGEEYRPENTCINGKNLLFIDSCHSHDANPYTPGFCNWSDIYYPHTDELCHCLSNLGGDETYVFSHHNLDPAVTENHRIKNAAQIRKILENSGKVRTVFQGHDHRYTKSDINGIHYITYPSILETAQAIYIADI